MARWTAQGKQVDYCLVTSGEAGIDALTPELAGPLRAAEERASAAVVGVDGVEFLGLPDGMLEYGLCCGAITAAIRRHRPEVVISLNHHDSFGSGALNQPDQIAVGKAVIDAVRDAGNRWVFPDLREGGLDPWPGVQAVLVAGSPLRTGPLRPLDQLVHTAWGVGPQVMRVSPSLTANCSGSGTPSSAGSPNASRPRAAR